LLNTTHEGSRPTVALANEAARIAWAVMTRGEAYHAKDAIGLAA
jgi:hypothetical protein